MGIVRESRKFLGHPYMGQSFLVIYVKLNKSSFYRAMHLSAYARSWDRMSSVCLSIRPSVTLVDCDHIGWKSRKLISRTISPTPSLLVAERRSIYSEGNMEKFGGDLRCGREKVACWRTNAAISLKRVKSEEKLL